MEYSQATLLSRPSPAHSSTMCKASFGSTSPKPRMYMKAKLLDIHSIIKTYIIYVNMCNKILTQQSSIPQRLILSHYRHPNVHYKPTCNPWHWKQGLRSKSPRRKISWRRKEVEISIQFEDSAKPSCI